MDSVGDTEPEAPPPEDTPPSSGYWFSLTEEQERKHFRRVMFKYAERPARPLKASTEWKSSTLTRWATRRSSKR